MQTDSYMRINSTNINENKIIRTQQNTDIKCINKKLLLKTKTKLIGIIL